LERILYLLSRPLLDLFQELFIKIGINHASGLRLRTKKDRTSAAGNAIVDFRIPSVQELPGEKGVGERLAANPD